MVFANLFANYAYLLFLVGLPILAMTINWVVMRRWRSFLAVLTGELVFLVSWLYFYSSLTQVECNPPQSCEGAGLGLVALLFATIVQAVATLIASAMMLLAYRKWVWKSAAPPIHPPGEGWVAPALLGGALLGLLTATGLALFAHSGLFNGWQRLEIPADIPVRPGIMPSSAYLPPGAVEKTALLYFGTYGDVSIGSDQGRVLQAAFQPPRGGVAEKVEWEIENGPPQLSPPLDQDRGYITGCGVRFLVLPPPTAIRDRILSLQCDRFQLVQAEYVLGNDGSLYAWRKLLPLYSFLRWPVVLGPLLGFLAALVLAMRWERRQQAAKAGSR
jgi:hypothetical protein